MGDLFIGLQQGLSTAISQALQQSFNITPPYAQAAAFQISSQFTTAIRPTVNQSFHTLYLLGACTLIAIFGWLMWLVSILRNRNERTVSMFIGCCLLIVLEAMASASNIGSIPAVPGYKTCIVLSFFVPACFSISCVARSLTVLMNQTTKDLLLRGTIVSLMIFCIVLAPLTVKNADYTTLTIPDAINVASVVPPVVQLVFAIGLFGLTLLRHVRKMSSMDGKGVGSQTTRMVAIVSNVCGLITTFLWVEYLAGMNSPRSNGQPNKLYAQICMAMIPTIEWVNDNFMTFVRAFFPDMLPANVQRKPTVSAENKSSEHLKTRESVA